MGLLFKSVLIFSLFLIVAACSKALPGRAPFFQSIGGYHYVIDTASPEAQKFFDQGLLFYYGYHFDDAERAFEEGVRLDPHCAMCYYGIALVQGSKNHTVITGKERKKAAKALKHALEYARKENERALVEALSSRYSPAKPPKGEIISEEETLAYVRAMRKVSEAFPNDLDAQVLFIDAFMQGSKQDFFTNGKPSHEATEMLALLDKVLKANPNHPGANHYYIHINESSADPKRSLPSADFLDSAHLGVEHLEHMPAHVYMQTGQYHKATLANQRAVEVHHAYQKEALAQGFEPVKNFLYEHDLHFLFGSAMMEGRGKLALDTARELSDRAKQNGPSLFIPLPYFAEARFGLWEEIFKEPQPREKPIFPIAMWHYARGLAFANQNKIDEAQHELKNLAATSTQRPKDVRLKIALAVLTATIADKTGKDDEMLKNWQQAVELQESMGFQDPPGWYFPTKEGLASALVKIGRPHEAEEILAELFKQYPENGWGLFILIQALRTQKKDAEADDAEARFEKAWEYADVGALPRAGIRKTKLWTN